MLVVRFSSLRWLIPVFGLSILLHHFPLAAATYTVTSTSNGGAGTLRAAISNANFFAGVDLINFNIAGTGPFTISLTTTLPTVREPVVIDATTQPGYAGKPRVELNGTSAGVGATGLYLQTSNCVVKGLAINRFSQEGVRIESGSSNVLQANFIGTGHYGTNSLGNGMSSFGGITIISARNVIGGFDTNRNVISGSNLYGIYLAGATANGNQIVGNHIGVDVTGTKRLGNMKNGIYIFGAQNTIIGGTNAEARNVLSGNYESGIYISSDLPIGVNALSNVIQGNFIGTDINGTSVLSNGTDGITLSGGAYNLIGGTHTGARNVISGNGGRGVVIDSHGAVGNVIQGNFIGTDVNGTVRLGNAFSGVEILSASNNIVGGAMPGARNVISANGLTAVAISGATSVGNAVQGNYIGTDATGTNALGNLRGGVLVAGISNNVIGGANLGEGNVISCNVDNGVFLADPGCRNNLVQGNYIGTDATGSRQRGNGKAGVRVEATGNLLGGTTVGAGNLISGNTNSGILFMGSGASNNVVQGNYIGTVLGGSAALGNVFAGINITNGANNTIGGTAAGARNLISGNSRNGIIISGILAAGTVIQGNYIGTDAAGANAVPNGAALGPQGTAAGGGVDLSGTPFTLIGGTNAGAGNLISGNWLDGVSLGDPGATNNFVQGNYIGTKADGVTALGNETHNISIRSPGGANNNMIGGYSSAAGNVIAHTRTPGPGYDGIRLRDGNTGNVILGNSMFGNALSATALAIDLGANGVNLNDDAACDSDTGANLLQNFPALTNAASAGSATRIAGLLKSAASSMYLIQFYANTAAASSGYGEGQTYLGATNVITSPSCTAVFSVVLPVGVPAGRFISATATDASNNTSEFGTNIPVVAAQLPGISLQPQSQTVFVGSNVTFTVGASGTAPLSYQWQFNNADISGATGNSLFLPSVQVTNAGAYRVIVSNTFGATNSATANLAILVDAPTLKVQAGSGGQIVISWPTNGPAFELQETTNLTPPVVWTDATNVPVNSEGQNVVTVVPTVGNRFYRLALP